MKIIFDSNVWQIITIPEDYPDEKFIVEFKKIHQAIIDKKIEPYLSETIFTIEAIRKVERQDFFSSAASEIDVHITEKNGDAISMRNTIGPNQKDAIHFSERPILKKYFDEAVKLGFKISRLPRIGGLVNPEVDKVRLILKDDELSKYIDKVFEVGEKIESRGAGAKQIEQLGNKYGASNWMQGLKKSPLSERKKIAIAAAEWADGDSVAISIALKCDYFCTRDKAKGAGSNSVLSQVNLNWLKTEYNFQTIMPKDLAKLIL